MSVHISACVRAFFYFIFFPTDFDHLLVIFSRGGVYTPGAAFAKTTLINRLNKHGIQFSVV